MLLKPPLRQAAKRCATELIINGELFSNGKTAMRLKWKLEIIIKSEKMEKLKNITPGEILLQEFLIPLEISQYRL